MHGWDTEGWSRSWIGGEDGPGFGTVKVSGVEERINKRNGIVKRGVERRGEEHR